MSAKQSTKVPSPSVNGFIEFLSNWLRSDQWAVNGVDLGTRAFKPLKPILDSGYNFVQSEWFITFFYLAILLIISRICYRTIICPIYCFLWRLVFCFI